MQLLRKENGATSANTGFTLCSSRWLVVALPSATSSSVTSIAEKQRRNRRACAEGSATHEH